MNGVFGLYEGTNTDVSTACTLVYHKARAYVGAAIDFFEVQGIARRLKEHGQNIETPDWREILNDRKELEWTLLTTSPITHNRRFAQWDLQSEQGLFKSRAAVLNGQIRN